VAYSAWLGGSLATEAQWEFVARGAHGRKYPWGDAPEPSCNLAIYRGCADGLVAAGVGRENGRTPEGVSDLAGNAWEWCRDWSEPYQTQQPQDWLGPLIGERRVLRGGAFNFSEYALISAFRFANFPDLRDGSIGFRMVSSPLLN
jgi:formylglycine-generating enzyme required for sulfatase activity